jgi:hypothetical protein
MHPGIVYDIDTESDPPRMIVCVIDQPLRYASVELEKVGTDHRSKWVFALEQFDATEFAIYDAIAVPGEN